MRKAIDAASTAAAAAAVRVWPWSHTTVAAAAATACAATARCVSTRYEGGACASGRRTAHLAAVGVEHLLLARARAEVRRRRAARRNRRAGSRAGWSCLQRRAALNLEEHLRRGGQGGRSAEARRRLAAGVRHNGGGATRATLPSCAFTLMLICPPSSPARARTVAAARGPGSRPRARSRRSRRSRRSSRETAASRPRRTDALAHARGASTRAVRRECRRIPVHHGRGAVGREERAGSALGDKSAAGSGAPRGVRRTGRREHAPSAMVASVVRYRRRRRRRGGGGGGFATANSTASHVATGGRLGGRAVAAVDEFTAPHERARCRGRAARGAGAHRAPPATCCM